MNLDKTTYELLSQIDTSHQDPQGSPNLKGKISGYDPIFIMQKFGDRLKILPRDLYDAVFECLKENSDNHFLWIYLNRSSKGYYLNEIWIKEAQNYLDI